MSFKWYKHWSVSAHRSVVTRYPSLSSVIYDSDHPFISYYDLLEGRKLRITDHHYLYILIQVLIRFLLRSYRREYRLLQNPYLHYIPHSILLTLYELFTDPLLFYNTFTDPLSFRNTLRTVIDPLSVSANSIPTRYELFFDSLHYLLTSCAI